MAIEVTLLEQFLFEEKRFWLNVCRENHPKLYLGGDFYISKLSFALSTCVENQAQHSTTCEHTFENLCALKGQESYHSLHIKLCVIESYSMTHN